MLPSSTMHDLHDPVSAHTPPQGILRPLSLHARCPIVNSVTAFDGSL